LKSSKKILVISPHFPPSNLASVHRSRLFVQHLPAFGWEPVVLMVDEKYYEETLDHNLESLLPTTLKIEKVQAFSLTRSRLIGDIGLRGFFQLYKRAKQLIRKDKIDFIYIPIPSFYPSLLGRWLYRSTGVKYGIDYIDPWVHQFPGSDKKFSRHWFSSKLAKLLEPIAVKRASLITGVAEGYYKGVQERNPDLTNTCVFGAMPYGGEELDHEKVKYMDVKPYLFEKQEGKVQLVYAGAMLPKAYGPLESIFKAINHNPEIFSNVQFHFIGTGKTPNDPSGYNIKQLAGEYDLWQKVIFEYPKRISYLDVLIHLNAADGVFILGSTEPHYTPSKVYQGVLSGKPILAILHQESTGVQVLRQSGGGIVLAFDGDTNLDQIENTFGSVYASFHNSLSSFDPDKINKDIFREYSAEEVTKKLVTLLNEVVSTT
jgi:hypothetical protein